MTAWQTRRLGDVCWLENGDRGANYPSRSAQTSQGIPFINAGHLTDDGIDIQNLNYIPRERFNLLSNGKIRAGDILFCLRGSLGKVASVGSLSEGAIASSLVIVRPRETVLNAYLLAYFHSDICDDMIRRFKNGAAQPNLSAQSLRGFTIPVPALVEQQRIVGILDEAFDGIATAKANAEKNLQNARALFESHLQSVFTQQNGGWQQIRLGEIVERLTNGYVGPTRNIYCETGIPYLLARHVKRNRLSFDGKTFISQAFNLKARKSILKTGDVLLVQSGHIGHSAVVPPEHEGHNCHAMIVITPIANKLDGKFLSWFFGSPSMQRHFESIRTGSTLKHLNCRDVIELKVPAPPVTTQHRIVTKLESLTTETQRLESIYQQKLAALEALKKSLLHQAFSGQL